MSVSAAQLTFWAYAALVGVSFASLGLIYTTGSIARCSSSPPAPLVP